MNRGRKTGPNLYARHEIGDGNEQMSIIDLRDRRSGQLAVVVDVLVGVVEDDIDIGVDDEAAHDCAAVVVTIVVVCK